VYSASDFDRFAEAIEASARRKGKQIVAEAESYSRGQLLEAEAEADRRFRTGTDEIERAVEAFWRKEKSRIEMNSSRERQKDLFRRKKALHEAVFEEIDRHFPELAECFLKRLLRRYSEGDLELYRRLDFRPPAAFRVTLSREKIVRLSRENLIVELTPEAIMEEFSERIASAFSRAMEGKS